VRAELAVPSDFPDYAITVNDNPDNSGSLFLAAYVLQVAEYPHYLMILSNSGAPSFFMRRMQPCWDFKVQPNGLLTWYDSSIGGFLAMDSAYTVVDTFRAGNDYMTDMHELRILPNGHAFLMGGDPQQVDMSQIVPDGNPHAIVNGLIIQELDAFHQVIFQWRSWDHFQITDATEDIDLTAPVIDYVHGNALDIDTDGNLLLSSRHLDEITKINRTTGQIVWRLGGENNQFIFINDSRRFSHQHCVRRIPNGNIILYDDGNLHTDQYSRAIEYDINEVNLTATLIWEYADSPQTFYGSQGSVQRLASGNTLIGWGGHPDENNYSAVSLTEVRSTGEKSFQLELAEPMWTYRAFRQPWHGTAARPYLVSVANDRSVSLTMNQFGRDDIAMYYIYFGMQEHPTALVDSTTSGSIVLDHLINHITYYARVRSKDAAGIWSDFSNEEQFTAGLTDAIQSQASAGNHQALLSAYPNPFNAATDIVYAIRHTGHVSLSIFNVLGQQVATPVNEIQLVGAHSIHFTPQSLPSGLYFYRLDANGSTTVKTMLLLK
jgi:hypothetical protein